MSLSRLAMVSVHTSPLAPMGGKKTGGMNVYIRELAQEIGRRGIAVDIFTRRSSSAEPPIDDSIGDNVRVIYLTAGPVQPLEPDEQFAYLSEFTSRLIAFATRYNLRYELVYSHYWLSGWVGAKLKEAWGTPFVQMFHTLGQMKQRITAAGGLLLAGERITTETDIVDKAERLIAATPAEEAQLIWLYRADKRKIRVIPPGVNLERFHPIAAETAQQMVGFAPESRVLLFVGRIEPLKGVDTILQALALLREHNPALLKPVVFALIGGNPNDSHDAEMMRLKELVDDLDLTEHVQCLGAKEQRLLPAYYAAATAVLMPSDYESFGMVALEAMASGTPVIASEVGGLAFLIRDGETGYHVPVRDPEALAAKIRVLLENLPESEQMGRRAARQAQEYAWSQIADRLLALFDDVLTRRKPARR